MTVSLEKSLTVVSRQPGVLPFGKAEGRETVRWDIVQLSDGTAAYECNNDGCGRQFDKPKAVFAHLASHYQPAPTVRSTRTTAKKLAAAIELLEAALAEGDKSETDKKVEQWKTRALTAERKLTALRKALSLSE